MTRAAAKQQDKTPQQKLSSPKIRWHSIDESAPSRIMPGSGDLVVSYWSVAAAVMVAFENTDPGLFILILLF